jgi:hypothetical protein
MVIVYVDIINMVYKYYIHRPSIKSISDQFDKKPLFTDTILSKK